MPFRPDPFLRRFERLRGMRARRGIGYVAALIGCAGAVGARWSFGSLLAAAPFTTFYPAIGLAALLGGPRAGVLALVLSAVSADYFFMPPYNSWAVSPADAVATGLFLFVGGLIIGLIALLNEAVDRLARQAENARFILDAEPAGIIAVDDTGKINLVNTAVEKQLGYERAELLGKPVEVLVPMTLRVGHSRLRGHFMADPEPRAMGAGRDLNAVRKDGSLVPVEVGLNPFERDGRAGALATIIDISERKRLEVRAQVLAGEVRHRANNLLAVVQALARRMLSGSERSRFVGVLDAIARTQELFASGANASLRSILEGELTGFQDQIEIDGCDLLLKPEVAQDFALIIHELTTNALKYGALSTQDGRVAIGGHIVDGRHFRFDWQERGGPPVTAPERRGFGSTILGGVAHGFAREVAAEYLAAGLRYHLSAALDEITSPVAAAPPSEPALGR